MSRRSRTSLPGLLARQFRADLGPLLAMAGIVLVIATLASAAPLALRSMTAAEVAYQFENLPASRRDLVSRAPGNPQLTPGASPFAQFDTALKNITATAPEPLRKTLGTANFVISTDDLPVSRLGVEFNDPLTPITFNASSALADRIRLTGGSLPSAFTQVLAPEDPDRFPINSLTRDPVDPQIDIVLSTKSAELAGWKVGEARLVMVDTRHGFYANLSGTFDALDPGDGFWAVARSTLEPGISHTPFSGSNTKIVTSAAYIDPGSWSVFVAETGLSPTTSVGIPLSTAGLTVEEDEALLPQLRRFTSQPQSVAKVASTSTVSSLVFGSNAGDVLATALERASTATSVLVMVASGPIGVAVAALWLLSRLIVLRRRDTLALASARGASGAQLRFSQALEVLALSLPAAAIGALIASWFFPSVWSPLSVEVAGIVALVPPILIALAASRRSLRSTRGDLDPRARGRYRWVLEVIVLALTALALALLLQRGLASNAESVGVDPLLASTPLLLALSAGLIVLRIYPLPLRGLARAAKKGKGIVSFLGASRSIRDPAAGLAPVLAMVVGLAVAVFSGVLLGTVGGGVSSAAHSSVGADLRIDSPILTPDQSSDIAAVEGVAESVGLYQDNSLVNLTVQDRSSSNVNVAVPVIVVDTSALARVQHGVPGTAHFDDRMSATSTNSIPTVLSPDLASQYSIGKDSSLAGVDIVSGGNAGTSPSLSGVEDWVLIDVANADALEITKFLPRITLVRLDDGADISSVKAALADIVGSDATIESPADVSRLLNGSPVSGGLQLALLAFIVIVALLCAATVVLALMISGPARERLLALLRTLGLTPRQARGITGWEIGPTSIVAIIVGLILGAVLPMLVLAGVDLRPFTGGVLQPAIEINPVLLALIIGGFALLVVIATAIAMAAARRISLAKTLRTSEEG
ncbi:MAG: FtsX-like permease family protein [Cryobacterium sp.]|nr:FtsX-like permease family protein [Cryobacterium sp.]